MNLHQLFILPLVISSIISLPLFAHERVETWKLSCLENIETEKGPIKFDAIITVEKKESSSFNCHVKKFVVSENNIVDGLKCEHKVNEGNNLFIIHSDLVERHDKSKFQYGAVFTMEAETNKLVESVLTDIEIQAAGPASALYRPSNCTIKKFPPKDKSNLSKKSRKCNWWRRLWGKCKKG